MIKFVMVSILAALATVAVAEEAAPAAAESGFATLDANADGAIDATEAAADEALNAAFGTVATDGKLDQAGYDAWKASQSAE